MHTLNLLWKKQTEDVEQRLEAITYLKNYATLNSIAELSNSDVEQTVVILGQTKEKVLAQEKKSQAMPQAAPKTGA